MEERKPSPASRHSAPSLRAKIYRYRSLLKRCWWVLLLAISVAVAVQGYLISQEAPTYVSQARMWVSGKVALPEGGLYREELQNFFGTQIELMRSEKIQVRARARARLLNPRLEESPVLLKVIQAPRAAVFILQGIGAEPLYTQAFVQSLMEEYLAYKKEIRDQSADEALAALNRQVDRPLRELKDAQEALQKFKSENNVVFLEQQGSSAGAYLAKLNTRLAELKTEHQLLELLSGDQTTDANKLLGSGSEAKVADLNAQMAGYQKVREQLLALKAERQDLGQYLKDKHPKMIKMDDEIARQERQLEFYRQQSKDQLVSTRQSVKYQIQNLEQSIREWEAKASEASRRMAEYDRLKENSERIRILSERLQNNVQAVGQTKHLDQENVSVMENASAAGTMRSGTARKLIVAFILGMAIGLGILYFVDRHDDRIASVGELNQHFDLPVMGHVPAVDVRRGARLELVHPRDQRHSFVEAFRDVRSALLFTADKGVRPKTILITSAIPNEGKSSVSANLAVTLALSGARVLLVDADLRCGTLHEIFGGAAEPGLHEVLAGQVDFGDVIRATATPNLHLIAAGKSVQTAGELFLNPVAGRFFKDIDPHYDFIVIDSAPVLATADTASLAPKIDGVLFVIRGSFTSARLSRNALDLLRQRQVNVLGLILNRADASYPEYYQYKYSKYYHRAAASA